MHLASSQCQRTGISPSKPPLGQVAPLVSANFPSSRSERHLTGSTSWNRPTHFSESPPLLLQASPAAIDQSSLNEIAIFTASAVGVLWAILSFPCRFSKHHSSTKWPRMKRIPANFWIAFCVLTAPLCTKGQVSSFCSIDERDRAALRNF